MSDIFGGTGLMPPPSPPGAQPNSLPIQFGGGHGRFGHLMRMLAQQQGGTGQTGMIAPHQGFGGNMVDPGLGGAHEGMYANFLAPGSFRGRAGAMPWAF